MLYLAVMSKHFKDYIWKGGIPYGIHPVNENEGLTPLSYKIVMDPYRKRISIEKYEQDAFDAVIYDSALLDFRHLKAPEQHAWQKTVVSESENTITCMIRNQDDRILFLETHLFSDGLCRECRVKSPHGCLLSIHRMFYTRMKDSFNGVILFDINEHPVMLKKYAVDPHSGEFTDLLEANWEVRDFQAKPASVASGF